MQRIVKGSDHHSGSFTSLSVFWETRTRSSFINLKMGFYLPQPAARINWLYPPDMEDRHFSSLFLVDVVNVIKSWQCPLAAYIQCVFVLRWPARYSFLLLFSSHSLFFQCHLVCFLCLQPFVIHDVKSLMEGEQFINCRHIPSSQERQPQTSTLPAGYGG